MSNTDKFAWDSSMLKGLLIGIEDIGNVEVVTTIQNSFIPIDCQELPLLNAKNNEYVINKHACPLCGGNLKPMGWFRESGIKEMLHKCLTCGLAVFRDVV